MGLLKTLPRFPPGPPGSEQALFLFLLALDAVARPRNSFEPLDLHFFLACHAMPVTAFLDAPDGLFHELQDATIVIALVEEEFLGVGIRRLVSDVLSDFLINVPAVMLRLCYAL